MTPPNSTAVYNPEFCELPEQAPETMKFLETEGIHNPPDNIDRAGHLVVIFRVVRIVCHILYGLLLACIYPLLKLRSRQRLMQHWSRALLDLLNVQLEIFGQQPPWSNHSALLVANHISWLDVFAINAANPSCFVAKSEVRSWPLIGLLCRLTMTIFVKRNSPRDALRTNKAIANTLKSGECVALFPEGTSSDGCSVGNFHSSLLQCSIDAETCIQPIAIRYHDGSGLRSSNANFIDDMTLIQSLLNILYSRNLHATLTFLPKVASKDKKRRTLAKDAHTAINTELNNFSRTTDRAVPASPIQAGQM
jgi:1-acyl-sn-glycerol-3-phosphate acyltransferase